MVKLDGEYYITADKYGLQLRRRYKPGKCPIPGRTQKDEAETVVGYYGSLLGVLNGYRRAIVNEIITEERLTLNEMVERIAEMDKQIVAKLRAKGFAELEADAYVEPAKEVSQKEPETEKAPGGKGTRRKRAEKTGDSATVAVTQ